MAANLELTAKEDISEKLFKIEQQNQRLLEQNRQLSNQLKQSHGDAMQWVNGQISSITSMVMGYASVQGAINAVTAALEHKEEVERRAKEITIGSADAQRNMLRNLGNVTNTQQDAFIKQLEDLNKQYSPSGGTAALYGEAAAVLSATAADRDLTAKIMKTTIQFAPDSSESRQMIGNAIGHLAKATGSSDPMENLGLLYTMGSQSAVWDPASWGKHMAPAVIGGTQFGGTAQESAAILAAITQGSADKQGRMSSNAAISLAKQLSEFLPEEDRYTWTTDSRGRNRRKIAAKGTGLTTELERIEYLREHPLESERFMSGMSVETKQEAAIRQLLTSKDTMTGKYLEGALKEMNKPLATMAKEAEAKIAQMNQPFGQGVASVQRNVDSSEKQLAGTLFGKESALEGLFSKENLDKQLNMAGRGWLRKGMSNIGHALGVGSGNETEQQFYVEQMKMEIAGLRYKAAAEANDVNSSRFGPEFRNKYPANTPELQLAETLERNLEKQLEEAKRLREEIEIIRAELEKQGRRPSPTAVQENRKQHGEK